MASPIDRHPFSPRLQLGNLARKCALCGEPESHENHQTDEQAKQAALDKHLTDAAREIAPKLRSLVGEDQQTVVTIALELARSRVTKISADDFRRAVDELAEDCAATLAEAHRKGVRLRPSSSPIYSGVCACGHAMERHRRGEDCEICECPIAKRRITGELVRHPLRNYRDEAMGVRRERQVVCPRCEQLFNPDLGECACADTCAACGHNRAFHRLATGSGDLPAGTKYCDDRHADPCACSGFIPRRAPRNPLASPEAEAAARRDHGDGDGRIPGRPECPSNECQIRQTCTGHAGCTQQYARHPVATAANLIEETLEAAYWTFDAARGGRGEWKGRTMPERDAFKLAVRRASIGDAALAELARSGPPHPTTPCIGCNPLRPCFNGWKACQRESDPIGSLPPYTHQTVVPKGDPVGSAELTIGELEDIRTQVATYSSDSVWRKLLAAFDKERARASGYTAIGFEVTSVPVARAPVLEQIAEERIRQDTKWGGPAHDDTHERGEWLDFIREHLERAKKQSGLCPSSAALTAYRHELIVIAALCVAAIETHDRKEKK